MFRRASLLAAAAVLGVAGAAQAQLSQNQTNFANALAAPAGGPTAGTVAVQTSLAGLSPADRANAYSQFTPGSLSLVPDLTLQSAEFEQTTIGNYLRDFRAGGTGVNGIAGQATPGDRSYGSFAVATGSYGHYDATPDRARTGYGSEGVMIGLDKRFGARSLIGVTAGYDHVDARLDPLSNQSHINTWFAGGYGTLGVGPLYVDLFGTYGETNYDLNRSVNFGAATTTPTALSFYGNPRGRNWIGGASTGLSFNFAGFEFEPFVGARYANVRINGFSDGTGVGALTLNRHEYESVLGDAGLRIGGAYNLGNGVSLRTRISGAYRHEFDRYNYNDFTVGFGAPTPTPVNFTPTGLTRDYATAGAGITISKATSPFSLVLDYNGEFANDRQINGITGGFRLSF